MAQTTLKTKKIVIIGLMCAMAYVLMSICRIPVVLWLKYEPKDVIITIGGFIFGPLASAIISMIVSTIEMITVSDTGIWGGIMNIISSCTFACTAAFIYRKKRTMSGAITGLIAGVVVATSAMMLWNYILTPWYMGYPREQVAELLLPAFLPFNLIKTSMNAALTLLFYKPLVTALRRSHLIEPAGNGEGPKMKAGVILAGILVILTCVFFILVLLKII